MIEIWQSSEVVFIDTEFSQGDHGVHIGQAIKLTSGKV